MILFPDLLFWVYLLVFFISVFIVFFIPADTLLMRLNLNITQRLTLGTCLGMVLWGWQGYIFGYLHVRFFSYLYILFFLVVWLKFRKKLLFVFSKINFNKVNILIFLTIILGSSIQLSSVFFAGVHTEKGILFNAYSFSDNIWYMNLTNQVIRNIPPIEPGFAGKIIQNYHYWSNLVMGELIRVFYLPFIPTVSQYFPILLSLLLAGTLISFCQVSSLSSAYLFWLLFFIYFGGDFVLYLQLFLGKGVNFSQQSMEDGSKFFANFPRAFAVVLLLSGLSFLSLLIKNRNNILGFLVAVLFGSIIGFKVYVGIFGIIGLICLSIYFILKKNYQFIFFTTVAIVLSLFIYLPSNSNSGGFIYTGFWIARDFIVLPSLGLSHLELAREIYDQHHNFSRVFLYDILFLLLFYVGTFGTKLFGIFQNKKILKIFPKEINIFLLSSCFISLILGTFFIQKSGGANGFNFIVNVFIFLSFYAALTCFYWFKRMPYVISLLLIIIVIILTIPRSMRQAVINISDILNKNGVIVDSSTIDAINFLNKQPSGIVYVPENSNVFNFLINKDIFFQNEGILETHGIYTANRRNINSSIYNSKNIELVKKLLKQNIISYLYLGEEVLLSKADIYFGKVIYNTNNIKIVEIQRNKL